jgi:hypothetical protein
MVRQQGRILMTYTVPSLQSAAPASKSTATNSIPDTTQPTIHGWAMLPHAIASDKRLSAIQVRVIAALMFFARSRTYCTACDRSLGAQAGGCSVGTIQRALRHLEALGYIRRQAVEPSDFNRTGRVIHLLWKTEGSTTGDRPPNHRRATSRSRVTDKGNVVVEGENSKPVTNPAPRSRPALLEALPIAQPEPIQYAKDPLPERAATATQPSSTLPFDLRTIGQPATLPATTATPPRVPASHGRRPRLGLTLEELTKVAGDDPILAAELARRTAPPPPPESPPATVPTTELFEMLPGRHDLIMTAARRLCEETGDFKVASQRTFELMATSVATRAVPAAVLISCWRQGTGPKAEHKGKVLVSAWMREAQGYSKSIPAGNVR